MSSPDLAPIAGANPPAADCSQARLRGEDARSVPDAAGWLDRVAVPVVVLDARGCVALLNRAGAVAVGFTPDEVRARPAWELELVFDSAARFRATWERVRAGDYPTLTTLTPGPSEDGAASATWSCAGVGNAEGALTQLVCTRVGPAEQLETEPIREELERCRAVLDGTLRLRGHYRCEEEADLPEPGGTPADWRRARRCRYSSGLRGSSPGLGGQALARDRPSNRDAGGVVGR